MELSSENLISLVRSRPEIWDHGHAYYTSKDIKLKAWNYIGGKLHVSADEAKAKWTNLRDLFRRELKKTLKLYRESGDPDAYKPRWKHFRQMMFLKDQIVKDDNCSIISLDETCSFYPETVLEDGEGSKLDSFLEDGSASTPNCVDLTILPETTVKGPEDYLDEDYVLNHRQAKRQRRDYFMTNSINNYQDVVDNSRNLHEMDDDYHFVMSILPSIRKIRRDRKTMFRLKVLQLIVDEENLISSQ